MPPTKSQVTKPKHLLAAILCVGGIASWCGTGHAEANAPPQQPPPINLGHAERSTVIKIHATGEASGKPDEIRATMTVIEESLVGKNSRTKLNKTMEEITDEVNSQPHVIFRTINYATSPATRNVSIKQATETFTLTYNIAKRPPTVLLRLVQNLQDHGVRVDQISGVFSPEKRQLLKNRAVENAMKQLMASSQSIGKMIDEQHIEIQKLSVDIPNTVMVRPMPMISLIGMTMKNTAPLVQHPSNIKITANIEATIRLKQ